MLRLGGSGELGSRECWHVVYCWVSYSLLPEYSFLFQKSLCRAIHAVLTSWLASHRDCSVSRICCYVNVCVFLCSVFAVPCPVYAGVDKSSSGCVCRSWPS